MHQSSPGCHSSCSSKPSPLDRGVDMAARSGGSLGNLSTLDDLPVMETMSCEESSWGVKAFGLQLRTSQCLEHLKKEKLKNVRDSCQWSKNPTPPVHGTALPPIPTNGSLLKTSFCPASGLGPLVKCSDKMTLLEKLSECRDSTFSSVYTVSRCSSGISPCFSSRHSNHISQFGANLLSNISSADSYDPISVDIFQLSSQTSQCDVNGSRPGRCGPGLPCPFDLTPAQNYCLKAKYAAAKEDAPPTPLQYMEVTHLTSSVVLSGDSPETMGNAILLSRQYNFLHRYPYSLRSSTISDNIYIITKTYVSKDATSLKDYQETQNAWYWLCDQRKMNLLNGPSSNKGPGQYQHTPDRALSAQWNTGSSCLRENTQWYSKLQVRGNLTSLQQNQNSGSDNLNSNQQKVHNLTSRVQQTSLQLSSEPGQNRFQQSSNLSDAARPEYRFCEVTGWNNSYLLCGDMALVLSCTQEPTDFDFTDFEPVQVKIERCDSSVMTSDQQNCSTTSQNDFQTENQNHHKPRPSKETYSLRLSSSKPVQQTQRFRTFLQP